MVVDFAQPCRMRRFVCVLKTPSEFRLCMMKVAWKPGMHDPDDPVHDENLAA